MKNLTTLLLTVLLIVSCSSDDNDNSGTNGPDPIIGRWSFGNVIYTLEDGSEIIRIATPCDISSFIRFDADNTVTLRSFVEDNNNDCELEPSNFDYFNWSKIREGEYMLISRNTGEAEEQEALLVSFPIDGLMVWSDDSPGFYNGEEYVSSKEQFTKMN